jgi:hypothetical protein
MFRRIVSDVLFGAAALRALPRSADDPPGMNGPDPNPPTM